MWRCWFTSMLRELCQPYLRQASHPQMSEYCCQPTKKEGIHTKPFGIFCEMALETISFCSCYTRKRRQKMRTKSRKSLTKRRRKKIHFCASSPYCLWVILISGRSIRGIWRSTSRFALLESTGWSLTLTSVAPSWKVVWEEAVEKILPHPSQSNPLQRNENIIWPVCCWQASPLEMRPAAHSQHQWRTKCLH